MIRTPLPGGHHAELLPIEQLNASHQDDMNDAIAEIRARKEAQLPEAPLDPANPAIRLEQPPVRLTRRDLRPVDDMIYGWIVQGCSIPDVVPWHPESRNRMPLPTWNTLRNAVTPYFEALNGEPPKEMTAST